MLAMRLAHQLHKRVKLSVGNQVGKPQENLTRSL